MSKPMSDESTEEYCEACGTELVNVQLALWCPVCDRDVIAALRKAEE